MTRNNVTELGCNEQLFKRIVKTAFNQRRKTMRNSLKPIIQQGAPILANEIFALRPEQISVAQFIELTNEIEPHIVKP